MSHTLRNSTNTGRRFKCWKNCSYEVSIKPALSRSKGKFGVKGPRLLKMEIMTDRLEILVSGTIETEIRLATE